jgi:tRNA-specific adenosine deaminase 1
MDTDSTLNSFTDWTPEILAHYRTLKYAPPRRTFTILAAIYLVRVDLDDPGEIKAMKIISMATGSKCLPTARFSNTGDVVHDFHAEVLARRGAVRWLLSEITSVCSPKGETQTQSEWLKQDDTDINAENNTATNLWSLCDGVTVNMYVSELPCKDHRP